MTALPAQPCYIIAEAGVNHNGSLDRALELIDAAGAAGADAVKFQTFKASELVSPMAAAADYQKASGATHQYEMLKALELSPAEYERIAGHCQDVGIEFLSTPFDIDAADFLIGLGMRRLKVPSGELTNLPFLAALAARNLPLILSTGMGTLDEVGEAVRVVETAADTPLSGRLTVLHCTTNYPTAPDDVNLLAMQTMANAFDVPVGYSDHTTGVEVPPLARALGAEVLEKHFTLDRTLPGPDHAASLEPDELTEMVRQVRAVDAILGDGVKAPTASEIRIRTAARRSAVMLVDAPAGTVLDAAMLGLKRPGDGIAPQHLERALGQRLAVDKRSGEVLREADLQGGLADMQAGD